MIVPVKLEVERRDEPESFSAWGGELVPHRQSPRYHVTATVLDTKKRRLTSYEFWSMVDPSRRTYENVGRITHVDVSLRDEQLRRTRDAINEVLGDPVLDADDWERVLGWYSVAYGESMVDARDESTRDKIAGKT